VVLQASCSGGSRESTFAAFCRRSPDSPTQILSTSFDTRISRMGLESFFSFCATPHKPCQQAVAKRLYFAASSHRRRPSAHT